MLIWCSSAMRSRNSAINDNRPQTIKPGLQRRLGHLSLVAAFSMMLPGLPLLAETAHAHQPSSESGMVLLAQLSGNEAIAENGIDPIITGNTVSDKDRKAWEERARRYKRCRDCAKPQAFPGDLPE